jgi:hypothetical protein
MFHIAMALCGHAGNCLNNRCLSVVDGRDDGKFQEGFSQKSACELISARVEIIRTKFIEGAALIAALN